MSYKLITLTAGHNAIIPGASGNGYKEHAVARLIVAEIEKQMKAVGQNVKDCTDNVGKNKTAVWLNAATNCNKQPLSGRLDVSVHLNAGGGTGVEVLYISQKALATEVSAAMAKALDLKDRGAKHRSDVGYLRTVKAPSILLEVGFMDNKEDMAKLMGKDGIKKVAESVVFALTGKKAPVVVPVSKPAAKPVVKPVAVPVVNGKTHVVKDGDTLWALSMKYKVTVDNLKKWNALKTDVLSVGQKLQVAAPVASSTYHVVKAGDTLFEIAVKYKTTVVKLDQLNPTIKNINRIAIGDKIRVA